MSGVNQQPIVTAVLGPTNTGKTHYAIDRMLGHASGMIGFPLRLLARENYDRVVAQKGAARVALVTGEEKIIPPRADYFICTVESMPLDREVEFLAIDEIQMCADPERGHIFTDRLLRARGSEETLFLGADTIRPLIRLLVPEAEFTSRPRLSKLTYVGPRKITRLPRRSAIVAFSINEVYAIAELMRRQRGGTAVVLGALSPRTRNAQVEMYQGGEVDYLVATDAIGMGLNMNIDHVAIAGLRKFDGKNYRRLSTAEIAQIAGRAGRHLSDGTFGPIAEIGALDEDVVTAIEDHVFEPLTGVYWRNSEMDYRSALGLQKSLEMPPPRAELMRARDADDKIALTHLMRDREIADRASTPDVVRLLWDICQIPDFRKTMADVHAGLLSRIFRELTDGDCLSTDWVAGQIAQLDRVDGDIDTLMARIAHTRTWTYISHRADWLDDTVHWQERTRAIEDRLSDALHEGLTQRFIDRRNAALTRSRGKVGVEAILDSDGGVFIEGERVGWLDGLRFVVDDDASAEMRRMMAVAAHRALQGEISRRIAALLAAPDDAFALDDDGSVLWRGARIATLVRGKDVLSPVLRIPPRDLLPRHMREQAEARLKHWFEVIAAKPLGALYRLSETNFASPARGIAFQLREGLGSLIRARAKAQIAVLQPTDRKALRQAGVRLGPEYVYLPALIKPVAVRLRAILWAVWNEAAPIAPPLPGLVTAAVDEAVPDGFYTAIGFVAYAGRAIRLDMLDRLSVELKRLSRKGVFALPPDIAPLLGLGNDETEAVIIALGYRRARDGAGFKPRPQRRGRKPAGEKIAKPLRQRPHRTTQPVEGSPFAALAALRLPS